MPTNSYRVIPDTNIVVRGFINLDSASGQILRACQRRQVVALLSRVIIAPLISAQKRWTPEAECGPAVPMTTWSPTGQFDRDPPPLRSVASGQEGSDPDMFNPPPAIDVPTVSRSPRP